MGVNVTYIILDGYIDIEKNRLLYFLVVLSVFVIAVCSNSTIVCLIWIHKNLHEPMYIFIAALLLNSILWCTALYPKILTDILSEKQLVTYSTCQFQWCILYAIVGAEFWLLMVMAYDRYLAICKPLQYPTLMKKSTVNVLLAVAWVVPAGEIAITFTVASNKELCNFVFRGIICNSTIQKLYCVRSAVLYVWGLFDLITLSFIPVIFNCFTYIRIFIIANRRGPEVWKKAVQTCLPHLVVLFNFCCLTTFDVLLARLDTEFPKIVRLIMSFQLILYHPLFNPIIYGLKMKEISKHLKRFSAMSKKLIQVCH